ncbi:MAG: 2Fe-2S iron-sulfur cluster binding domain-containing protein [Treponema sp.]|jgi:carbon-monoxide dehydrogenase small subunit|nr:2Fe-2S iron-sulfur cluster binding domain-containing protein [Treponema sp.]
MIINFILNGEDVEIDAEAEKRLIDILRLSFGLCGAKTGCYTGICGLCSVILNGDVVKSCLVPAFKIQGQEIITIEGFSQNDEYNDIMQGLAEAGIENCGYCNTGKILTIEALLTKNPTPSPKEILMAFHGIKCRCTEPVSLVNGVQIIAQNRQRRLYGRNS